MSTGKKKSTQDVNKERLAALRKLGLAPKVSNPRTLSDKDKKKVREAFKKYGTIATADKGEYVKKSVKNYSKADRKRLTDSGYIIAGDSIYLPTQGYQTASIRKSWTKDEFSRPRRTIEVVRKIGDRKTEVEYIGTNTEKLEWRNRLLQEYGDKKFKEGDWIAVKVFDNGTFEREIIKSLDVLFRYIENIKWHDKDKGKMLDNLHLVKITVKDIRDLAANEKSQKEVNHTKYIRKKNRAKTGAKKLSGKITRN